MKMKLFVPLVSVILLIAMVGHAKAGRETFAVSALAREEYQITATLQAPELEEGAAFGSSVAVSGDVVAVGERLADVEGVSDAGRAYIIRAVGEPADKFGSWAPYIVLASAILVVAAATAIWLLLIRRYCMHAMRAPGWLGALAFAVLAVIIYVVVLIVLAFILRA